VTADPSPQTEVATLGAGCFWCVEAVLQQIPGVIEVRSGYMGGEVDQPTYEQVCSGMTGHAEVTQVTFDLQKLAFAQLLQVFWQLHDPTTKDRQGNDVGTQYRSAIFYHSEEQQQVAESSKQAAQADFPAPIVTQIAPATEFFVAEGYHQNYYRMNQSQSYCRFVILPKLKKLGLES
jgi:peptide-methionine (S)-S-oxide reductase